MSFGIRAKLLAGFGAVLFLLAVVAAFGLLKINEADEAMTVLGEREMTSLQTAMDAQVQVVTISRELRQAILMDDAAAKAKAKAGYEAADKAFVNDAEELGKLLVTPAGKASLAEATTAFGEWKKVRDRILDLAIKGDVAGATDVLQSDENAKPTAGSTPPSRKSSNSRMTGRSRWSTKPPRPATRRA